MTIVRTPTQTEAGLDATRALALDALRLARLLRDSSRWPPRWRQPAFGRDVELVRRSLARIGSQRTLAASYRREVFDLLGPGSDRAEGSAIRVAYAVRWLELQDGAIGPAWSSMIG